MKLSFVPAEEYEETLRRYDGLVAMNHALPNFPLIGTRRHEKFSHVMKEMDQDRSLEYSADLYKQAAKDFPGMPNTLIAMRLYFQLRHSQPAISDYNQEHAEIMLLLPVYGREQFYTMQIKAEELGEILEDDVLQNDTLFTNMKRETFKDKPQMQQFPVPMSFAEASRRANTNMCDIFEKITCLQIYDPARVLEERKKEIVEELKTNTAFLVEDMSISDSVHSNLASIHVDNMATLTMAAPFNKNGTTHSLTILN